MEWKKHRLSDRISIRTSQTSGLMERVLTKVYVWRARLQLGDAVELSLVVPLENHDDRDTCG
jgi:hypothetical protein